MTEKKTPASNVEQAEESTEQKQTAKKQEKKPAAEKGAEKAAMEKTDDKTEAAEQGAEQATEPAEKKPAAKKAPKERHFVDATTGEEIAKPKQGGTGEATREMREEMHAERRGNALPFRIGAIVLWVLGIACEITAILTSNGTLFLPGPNQMTWMIIWIVADLVLVVIGSQLWKRANHISPASKENKLAYWVQTQLGVIIAVVAFAPVILLMLTNKDMDKKSKQICSIIAAVALAVAVGSGIDFNPATQEDLDQAEAGAAVLSDDGLCYWTPFGKKYHFNPDCQYLKNSGTIYSGTIAQAMDSGRNEGCTGCTVENGTDLLANADPEAVKSALANVISIGGGSSDDDASTSAPEDEALPEAA